MDTYIAANAALSVFAKQYMEWKKGLPIRPSEMGVLNIITATDGVYTPAMLAELLGVTKPMITAHITSLEGKGYIKREPSTEDKRVCYIRPTEQGLALAEYAHTDLKGKLDGLIAGMGLEEFDTLVRLADKANRIMEDKGE